MNKNPSTKKQNSAESSLVFFGTGAVALALASQIQRNANLVPKVFIGRTGVLKNVYAKILGQNLDSEDIEVQSHFENQGEANQAAARGTLVFICTDAWGAADAVRKACSLVQASTPIIVLSNGAVESGVAQACLECGFEPDQKLRAGIVTVGIAESNQLAERKSYTLHGRDGSFAWGPWSQRFDTHIDAQTTAEANLLSSQNRSPRLRWIPDAIYQRREKWLLNAVINSLCAAYQLPRNGLLFTMTDKVDEGFHEAYALGLEMWGPWQRDPKALHAKLWQVIKDTAQNENSMARTLRRGRITESAFLAGLAVGREHYPNLKLWHSVITA